MPAEYLSVLKYLRILITCFRQLTALVISVSIAKINFLFRLLVNGSHLQIIDGVYDSAMSAL